MGVRKRDKFYGLHHMPNGRWRCKVPEIRKEDGYRVEYFDDKAEAIQWITDTGLDIWGSRRWALITNGWLVKLRSLNYGVRVYLRETSYERKDGCFSGSAFYEVRWRDGVSVAELSRSFKAEDHNNCMETAEHAAYIFAAKKKAELTGGELNLPATIQFEHLEY